MALERTPAGRKIEHTNEYLDLVGFCHSCVATLGRLGPRPRDREFTDDERETVRRGIARVRAAPTGSKGDCERLPQHSEPHLNWSLITLMTRRPTRKGPRQRWLESQEETGLTNVSPGNLGGVSVLRIHERPDAAPRPSRPPVSPSRTARPDRGTHAARAWRRD
ncbi:DUF6192 family protein [Streptomyces sp. NPDC097727]|uniref:DUF6192 family protein n=1 Tax=Streptomyces sp. NPDC097727 TaxID=3366092 RepID=UPI00381D2980